MATVCPDDLLDAVSHIRYLSPNPPPPQPDLAVAAASPSETARRTFPCTQPTSLVFCGNM